METADKMISGVGVGVHAGMLEIRNVIVRGSSALCGEYLLVDTASVSVPERLRYARYSLAQSVDSVVSMSRLVSMIID